MADKAFPDGGGAFVPSSEGEGLSWSPYEKSVPESFPVRSGIVPGTADRLEINPDSEFYIASREIKRRNMR